MRYSWALLLLVLVASGPGASAQSPPPVAPVVTPPPFDEWLTALKAEAIERGIASELVERAFTGLLPVEQILERDRTQAEFALDLEAYFGRFAGVRPTNPALVTLAYDPRRGAMFRDELFSALQIVNRGDVPLERLKGSWAGALGQPQFLPSSYLEYAQDFDGDGVKDIWTSRPDVFASIAFYLQKHGWKGGEAWGREVRIPSPLKEATLAIPR